MFSFEKRTNAINYGDKDRAKINELILAVQEKHGKEFSNIKELFEFLLNHGLSENEPQEIEPKTVEIVPANALILDENSEIVTKCTTLLQEFANSKEIGDNSPAIQILKAIELSNAEPKTVEIEKKVEVPMQIGENQILINLTDEPNRPIEKKKIILDEIQKRRHAKFGTLEPMDLLLEKMIFNDNIIFNLGGEFFTGF